MYGKWTGTGSRVKHTARVSQAAGMVSVQVGCLIEEALVLIYDRADASPKTVDELAAAVIDGAIRFDA